MSSADTRKDSQIRVYDRAASAVFLKTNEEFGGLSNMAGGFPLLVNGLRIFTSEALYQACRFPHLPAIQRMILAQPSPMTAKMKSKPYRRDSRPDWNRVRIKVMRWCLRVKLAQNWTRFSELLLATGDRPIVEFSRKDDFWGAKPVDDHTLVGMNVLGRLLMELREEVRSGACSPPMRVEPLQVPDFLLDGDPIQPVLGAGEVEDRGSLRRQERRVLAPEPIAMAVQVPMFDRPLVAPSPLPGISVEKEGALDRDLKPYPAYKDSGVPWLGQVPAHWEIRRIKLILDEITDRSEEGAEDLLTVSQYTGVTRRSERVSTEDGMLTNAASLVGYKRVVPGDLVINIMLAWNGSLGVSRYEGIVSPAYCVFRARRSINPWFIHYLLRSPLFTGVVKTVSTGVVDSRLRLYPEVFFRLPSLIPPLPEQSAIVRFLDHADRRIQRYIRAKKKLIALLNEQKQAIIHRAVTRGLSADIRLKASLNRWFPEVPEHWDILPMRRLIRRAVDGPHHSPQYVDKGIPFLSARNVKSDRWSLEDAKYITEDDYNEFCKRVTPELGDVLYTKGGTTGVARVVDLEFRFQVWVHVAVLKLNKGRVLPKFLASALNSPRCYEQAQLFTRGATNQDLGLGRMKDIILPIPPLPDQQVIVDFIESETTGLDRALDSARREIDFLYEFRTRLIADVVTGKLDVREAAARLPEETEEPEPMDEGEAIEDEVEGDLDDLVEEAVA